MSANALSAEAVLEAIKASHHQKVKVAITDIDGVLRGKYIHKNKFLSAAEGGFGFCDVVFGWDINDVCYDNVRYTGWHTGYPDAQARLDLSTYRSIPWDDHVPFLLGDFEGADRKGASVCPRRLLRKVIERAEEMGLESVCGLEFEWFNFQESPDTLKDKRYVEPAPLTPGMFGYSVLRSGFHRDYFGALMDELEAFRVPLEGLHTETGPGVYEAAILCDAPLEAADRGVLFKTSVKEIAYRFGIMPSFMAKWNPQLPGCSGHLHQSLWRDGENLFYDAAREDRMSETFRHYLAGQMRLLPQILPFFAPTVNSYKRLVEGMWAPTRMTWGIDNRTAAFRVIPGSPKSTRLETRVGGSDINPYLAVAAAIASGLYGIEQKLEPEQEAVQGNAYEVKDAPLLPSNLGEAAEALSGSEIAKQLFGVEFVEHFANTRRWEWRQYQQAVTNWEMERYFEIV